MSAQLVLYHTPWCGHCTRFKSNGWSKFKNLIVNETDSKMSLLIIDEIDCQQYPEAAKNINGYPTVILYKNGKAYEYKGNRHEDDLYNFVKSLLK